MRRLLLSFFGAGYLKPAPGTWGSLAAIPAAWLLTTLGGPYLLCFFMGLCYVAGVAATQAEMDETGAHDPSWAGLFAALVVILFAFIAHAGVAYLVENFPEPA